MLHGCPTSADCVAARRRLDSTDAAGESRAEGCDPRPRRPRMEGWDSRTRPTDSTAGGGSGGTADDESVPSARLIMGETGHATAGAGRRRPDRAPELAPDPPVRGSSGER